MNYVEIFALIVIAFSIVKMVTILLSPKSWVSVIDTVWKYPMFTMAVSFILAIFVFVKIMAFVTMAQFFAVLLLIALISAMSIAVYAKEFVPMAEKLIQSKGFVRKIGPAVIVWVILIVLGLAEIFGW